MIQVLLDVLFQIFRIFITALPLFSYAIVQKVFGFTSIYNKFHEQNNSSKNKLHCPFMHL